jgi:hypothetical protein
MYLWVSYKKKYDFFLFIKFLKSLKKVVGSGVGPIRIRIRTNMSRIPNTGLYPYLYITGLFSPISIWKKSEFTTIFYVKVY